MSRPTQTNPFRRKWGAAPLADLVAPCIGPALAKQGFGESDVLMHWPEIVGSDLADHCRPLKLQWQRQRARADPDARTEPATLVVRVEGAFAIRLQHMAPVILEKVNAHLGWRCVGKLALRQGPLPPIEPKRRAVQRPDAAARSAAEAAVHEIESDGLREALVRLGSSVLQKTGRP